MTDAASTHPATADLTALADELLAAARAATNGRASRTLVGGSHQVLRHTLLVLVAGQQLPEHASPGEATLQVLRGSVVVRAGDDELPGGAGTLLTLPDRPHSVAAVEDAVLLLSVAKPEH
ncbi:MAG: cupin domain-containing protein [Mycobacteriales bacterium]